MLTHNIYANLTPIPGHGAEVLLVENGESNTAGSNIGSLKLFVKRG